MINSANSPHSQSTEHIPASFDTFHKSKSFLLPILSLVILSIVLVAFVSACFSISMMQEHMDSHIQERTQNYTTHNKEEVKQEVYFVKDTIEYEIQQIEEKLKASLKEKVTTALGTAHYIYDTHKDQLSKEEIKEKIAKALKAIRFDNKANYFFMYDNKTKVIFGHPMEEFIGKDMTHYEDAKGRSLMETDAKLLEKQTIGFNKIYFKKPDNTQEEFPKITCIATFEPLDLVIGTGDYLDDIKEATKKAVLHRFSQPMYNTKDEYLVILDVHNIQGGDDFATVLINANKAELVGSKVSDKGTDAKGNQFRKDFLDLIKEKGEGYSEYWYEKPSTGLPAAKVSYVYFQKEWNWIILNGFYYEDLEKEIAIMQEELKSQTQEMIYSTLFIVSLLLLLVAFIAVLVAFRIDKTIKRYTDRIIHYENNKRKQEARLRMSEKRYRALFENMNSAFMLLEVVYDKEGVPADLLFLLTNEGFEKATGLKTSDVAGRQILEVLPDIVKDEADWINRYLNVALSGESMQFEEGSGLLGRHYSVSAFQPAPQQCAVTFVDITERETLHRELARLNTELEAKVKHRTAQLEASNKELEAFSYSVSHDLQAPLRHISGYVDLLNKRFGEALPEKAARYLHEIKDSAQQMKSLIYDLLQLSRISRQELKSEAIDMNATLQEAMRQLEADKKGRDIAWTIATLPQVHGDFSLMRQVWINLLGNAIKYTGHTAKAQIEVGYTEKATQWEFFVRDNGAGFDMQYAHKLFGVFQRLHSEAEFEGSGIGLANVQRIVHKHGGEVRAEGHLGEGATFYFTIPKNSNTKGV